MAAPEATERRHGWRQLWRRGQRGWPPRFPVAQVPNAPLLVAASGWLVAELADGSTQAYARAVFYAAFAIWAGGELVSGANWFRRALGAAGLIYVALEVATLMAA